MLDTYSGSIHVVDDIAYDIIGMYESASEEEICREMLEKYGGLPEVTQEEIKSCIDDVKGLADAGKLFAPDIYEGISGDFKNNSRDIKALCLHVAHSCNLNCSYCFAGQGKYQGESALMPLAVTNARWTFWWKTPARIRIWK